MASEPLGAAVNQGLQAVRIVLIHHADQSSVDPSSCFDAVQTADDDVELQVIVFVLVLNLAAVWVDLDPLDTLFHKTCSNLGFGFSDVCLAEEELAVEVGYVDCVCLVVQYGARAGQGVGVPMSMTSMFLNPDKARFLRISHPRPPAPLRKVNWVGEVKHGLVRT